MTLFSMVLMLCSLHTNPERAKRKLWAPAVERFFARGAGPRMMNIVLSGANGEAESILQKFLRSAKWAQTICCCTRWKLPAPMVLD